MANTRQTCLLFGVAFLILRYACYSLFANCESVPHYQHYADRLREASLDEVYRSDADTVDYPQLALLLMKSAGWLADRLPEGSETWVYHKRLHGQPVRELRFETAYAILVFLCDAAIFVCLCVIVPGVLGTQSLSERLAQYLIIGTIFAGTLYTILDVYVGASALAAWLAVRRNHYLLAYVFLALGAAFKIVPILLVPIVIFAGAASHATNLERPRSFGRSFVKHVLQATAIVSLWPILAYAFGGGRDAFEYLNYHSDRGFEIGSNYAWPILLAEPDTRIVHEYQSYTLRGNTADWLARLSTVISLAALLAAYAVVFLRLRAILQSECRNDSRAIVNWLLTGMAFIWVIYIAFGKVGSPQYGLWLMPLVPLLPRNRSILCSYLAFCIACNLEYPWAFGEVIDRKIGDIPPQVSGPTAFGYVVLISRTVTLAWLGVLIGLRLRPGAEMDTA